MPAEGAGAAAVPHSNDLGRFPQLQLPAIAVNGTSCAVVGRSSADAEYCGSLSHSGPPHPRPFPGGKTIQQHEERKKYLTAGRWV